MKISELTIHKWCSECPFYLLDEFRKATKIIRWIDIDLEIDKVYMCNIHTIEEIELRIRELETNKEKIENE